MSRNFNAMGTRIKMRRKELKMSQAELAEKINVSNNHISSIETGKQLPSLPTFVDICEQLQTTPDFLLLGSLHTRNIPQNIYESLLLCNERDLPIIKDLVEDFVANKNDKFHDRNDIKTSFLSFRFFFSYFLEKYVVSIIIITEYFHGDYLCELQFVTMIL